MSQATPPTLARSRASWNPGRRAWWWIAAAFALGLLLFVLLWMDRRGGDDFFRAPAADTAEPGRVFQPLPAPLPAGEGGTASAPTTLPDGGAQVLEPMPAPPAPSPATPARTAEAPAPVAPPAPAATRRTGGDSAPRPVASPPPDYPRAALRSSASGTVLLRVDVAADGRAVNVAVSRGSGNRDLDRAAVNAVRRWRFEPARRNGEPVMGTLDIPIEFKLD